MSKLVITWMGGGGGGKKCNNVDAYKGYLVLEFTITKLRNTFCCSVVLDEAQDQIILTCSVLPLSYIQVHSFSAPVVSSLHYSSRQLVQCLAPKVPDVKQSHAFQSNSKINTLD